MEHQDKDYWYTQERENATKYPYETQEQDRGFQPRNVSMSRAVSNDMVHDERPPQYRGQGPSSYQPYPPPVSLPPPQQSLPPAEHLPHVKREEEDTEMRDEVLAPPQEAEGSGFTPINRSH